MGKQTCTIQGRTIAISHGIHLYPQSFEFTSPTTHQPAISQRLNLYTIASLSRIDQCRGKNKRIDDIFWIVRFLSRLDLRTIRKTRKRERKISPRFNVRRRTIVGYDRSLKYLLFIFESRQSISQLTIATDTFPHGRD